MKTRALISVSLLLAMLILPVGEVALQAQSSSAALTTAPAKQPGVYSALGQRAMFVQNVGQFDARARFLVRGADRALWLGEDALWITLPGCQIRLTFPGANPHPLLEPFDRLRTRVSYFRGQDPGAWHADVPVWGGVRFVDLYPGIDLEMQSENGWTGWRMVAQPGAHLGAVRLRVDGANELTQHGDTLRLATAVGEYALPLLSVSGGEGELPALAIAGNEVASPFARDVGKTDRVASPQSPASDLLYSTFLGGFIIDEGLAIAVDVSGNAYVAGSTYSPDFPTTPGAFDPTSAPGTWDIFVAKLDPTGSDLLCATYLSGSAEDGYWSGSIAADGEGNAYVASWTESSDFPTTVGAYDRSYGGSRDAFVSKLNSTGTALVYSTFLGGAQADEARGIAVDGAGSAYVAGLTDSDDFPATPGAYDTLYYYLRDAFVVKLNPAGNGLVYATFLGGRDSDAAKAIALDEDGSAYVAGGTGSPNFPASANAFDKTLSGSWDAFVAKLNPAGSELVYCSYLGGSSHDSGMAIAVDAAGGAYVMGRTGSPDFPTTQHAFDTTYSGGTQDVFVAKVDSAGSALVYGTFLGGNLWDEGRGLAVDSRGCACIVGETTSPDFPVTPRTLDATIGGFSDGFVAKLRPDGKGLVYSTFLGGSEGLSDDAPDSANSVAMDSQGDAYITGKTECFDFPITRGAYDTRLDPGQDAFVTKLALPAPNVNLFVQAPLLAEAPPSGTVSISIAYGNLGATAATTVTLQATLGSHLTYVSDTSGRVPALNGDTLTWSLADLAFRDHEEFVLRVSLPGSAPIGTHYPLTLTIHAAGTEDDPADNTAHLEVVVVQEVYLPVILRRR